MPGIIDFGPQIQTGRVEHLPFRARFEAESRRSGWLRFLSDQWTGSIDRDSRGRVRTQLTRKGRLIATTIYDPVAGVLRIRDEQSGVEQRLDSPGVGATGRMVPPADAETKTIEGLTCFRVTLPEIVHEAWVSEELQHVISETTIRTGRRTTWRLHDISRIEPPPDLFQASR